MNELYPHTPSPWLVGSNGRTAKVVDANEKAICMVTARRDAWNGHIIAAAPDMLAALEAVVKDLEDGISIAEDHGATATWLLRARARRDAVLAAIAKAKGK